MATSPWIVGYDNQRRTLKEIKELAREVALGQLERLGLDLVYDRQGHAQYEIDVTVKITSHSRGFEKRPRAGEYRP